MNKLRLLLILILITLVYLSLNVNSAFVLKNSEELINAYKNQNLVRLHVVASSNTPGDQYLKRKVRDEITKIMVSRQPLSADNLTRSNLEQIKEQLQQVLSAEDIEVPLALEFGEYEFPRRTYGQLTLPAGKYRALKVLVGRGQGSNWWCVLFPPLCLFEDRDIKPGDDLEFRLKIGELVSAVREKNFLLNPLARVQIN